MRESENGSYSWFVSLGYRRDVYSRRQANTCYHPYAKSEQSEYKPE